MVCVYIYMDIISYFTMPKFGWFFPTYITEAMAPADGALVTLKGMGFDDLIATASLQAAGHWEPLGWVARWLCERTSWLGTIENTLPCRKKEKYRALALGKIEGRRFDPMVKHGFFRRSIRNMAWVIPLATMTE